jgi:hypothetical protein
VTISRTELDLNRNQNYEELYARSFRKEIIRPCIGRNVSKTDKSLHVEYDDEDRAWWVDLCHHKFRLILYIEFIVQKRRQITTRTVQTVRMRAYTKKSREKAKKQVAKLHMFIALFLIGLFLPRHSRQSLLEAVFVLSLSGATM